MIWIVCFSEPDTHLPVVRRAWVRALDALRDAIGGTDTVIAWNDAPERTHAEVLAAFDKAIAAERAKLSEPA